MSLEDVRWIEFLSVADERGVLTALEGEKSIPFEIKRIFYMHHLTGLKRGEHAHRDTKEVIIAIAGHFKIDLFDGISRKSFMMDNPNRGLYMPEMTWVDVYDFSADAICLVLANTHYDSSQSIRDQNQFLKEIGKEKNFR